MIALRWLITTKVYEPLNFTATNLTFAYCRALRIGSEHFVQPGSMWSKCGAYRCAKLHGLPQILRKQGFLLWDERQPRPMWPRAVLSAHLAERMHLDLSIPDEDLQYHDGLIGLNYRGAFRTVILRTFNGTWPKAVCKRGGAPRRQHVSDASSELVWGSC